MSGRRPHFLEVFLPNLSSNRLVIYHIFSVFLHEFCFVLLNFRHEFNIYIFYLGFFFFFAGVLFSFFLGEGRGVSSFSHLLVVV